MGSSLIKSLLKRFFWGYRDLLANAALCKAKNVPNVYPIKVAFIVQMPEIWDKQKTVYEQMVSSPDFDPWLLVVPSYDFSTGVLRDYGQEWTYFSELYPNGKILKAIENEQVIDLAAFNFSYVFFQRPYEHYLPEPLHTKNVIRYAKTCYIPYCYHCLKDPTAYFSNNFFRHLSLFFCPNNSLLETSRTLSLRRAVYCGYPTLDDIPISNKTSCKRITWTPRWTNDASFGGTSFFRFRKDFLSLADLPDTKVLFRPHPLMFDNAIRENTMTQEEVNDYQQALTDKCIQLDKNPLIEDTFKETELLLTDFSSIVVPFFLTGKPIIYCGKTNLDFSIEYQQILEYAYIAQSWEDVMQIIRQLQAGQDPLREQRIAFIRKKFQTHNSVEKIFQTLIEF